MICVNELNPLRPLAPSVLRPLTVLLAPFAPHLAEELWHHLHDDAAGTVCDAQWPVCDSLSSAKIPTLIPFLLTAKSASLSLLPVALTPAEVEAAVLAHPLTLQRLEGRSPRKVIVVPHKIVNIVS